LLNEEILMDGLKPRRKITVMLIATSQLFKVLFEQHIKNCVNANKTSTIVLQILIKEGFRILKSVN